MQRNRWADVRILALHSVWYTYFLLLHKGVNESFIVLKPKPFQRSHTCSSSVFILHCDSWALHHHIWMMIKISLYPSQTKLGRGFWRAVGEVVKSNADMDFLSSTRSNPVYHFDSERVDSAMGMLRQIWAQTLLSVRAKEYQRARHSLGQLFHSLQVNSSTVKDVHTWKFIPYFQLLACCRATKANYWQ